MLQDCKPYRDCITSTQPGGRLAGWPPSSPTYNPTQTIMDYTIKIKQDRYTTPEEFKAELHDAILAIIDFARLGDEMPISELGERCYVLNYLLRDTEITIE